MWDYILKASGYTYNEEHDLYYFHQDKYSTIISLKHLPDQDVTVVNGHMSFKFTAKCDTLSHIEAIADHQYDLKTMARL